MAVRANQSGTYEDGLLIGAPAVLTRRGMSLTLRREAALAYSILSPTLLVILFLVAFYARNTQG